MKIDIHNHTSLCNHAEGSVDEFVQTAIEKKIDVFGFSDHAPMKFDPKYRMSMEQKNTYEKWVLDAKEKYKDDIEILLGYEVDWLNGYLEDDILNADVDYLIGSVHFIDKWGFDNPEFIGEYQHKDINHIWEQYFNAIEEMAKSGKFDIVGHLDLIKVFKFMPTKDIRMIAKNALQAIKKSNMVIEINPAGLRKPIKEQYPSNTLLQEAYSLEIPVTFGSDAHRVSEIDFMNDEIKNIARCVGFTECVTFRNRDKISVRF